MKCNNCGSEINSGEKFCSNCGANTAYEKPYQPKKTDKTPIIIIIILGVLGFCFLGYCVISAIIYSLLWPEIKDGMIDNYYDSTNYDYNYDYGYDYSDYFKDYFENEKEDYNKYQEALCNFAECLEMIEIDMTVDEINEIIGFDGEEDNSGKTVWEFDDDTQISVTFSKKKSTNIQAYFDYDDFRDSQVDLSRSSELKEQVDSGITYEEFKKYIGNVDGMIVSKSKYSNSYVWINKNGGYVRGTFSVSKNQCTFYYGLIK